MFPLAEKYKTKNNGFKLLMKQCHLDITIFPLYNKNSSTVESAG